MTARNRAGIPSTLLAAAIALAWLAPLGWAVVGGLLPGDHIFRNLNLFRLFDDASLFTFRNYAAALTGPFARALANSLLVTAASVALGLAFCSLAGFGLAMFQFRFKPAVFAILVVGFLVPFDAVAVPLASILRGLGLMNTLSGLVLPGIGSGLAIFLLRQFFLGMPQELSEAARVDGLGSFGIFLRIYLPLSKPALVGAGLILFVFQWQAFLWPLMIAPAPALRVAAVAVADFAQQYNVDFGELFAAAVITGVVPMVVMLFLQNLFTTSVASSGGKT